MENQAARSSLDSWAYTCPTLQKRLQSLQHFDLNPMCWSSVLKYNKTPHWVSDSSQPTNLTGSRDISALLLGSSRKAQAARRLRAGLVLVLLVSLP